MASPISEKPRRLALRYLVTNAHALFLMIRDLR